MPRSKISFGWVFAVALAALTLNRSFVYDLIYGFDDHRSYYATVVECRAVVHWFPDNGDEHRELADLLIENMYEAPNPRARLGESIHEYLEAIRCNPSDATAYFQLAGIYESQFSDDQTANVFYRKSVEIDPTAFSTQSFLAASDERIGKHDDARLHRHISDQLKMGEALR